MEELGTVLNECCGQCFRLIGDRYGVDLCDPCGMSPSQSLAALVWQVLESLRSAEGKRVLWLQELNRGRSLPLKRLRGVQRRCFPGMGHCVSNNYHVIVIVSIKRKPPRTGQTACKAGRNQTLFLHSQGENNRKKTRKTSPQTSTVPADVPSRVLRQDWSAKAVGAAGGSAGEPWRSPSESRNW